MKNRILALIMVGILALSFLSGCGGSSGSDSSSGSNSTSPDVQPSSGESSESSGEDAYQLIISHSLGTTDFGHLAFVWFKEQIEERTGGRIQVTIYDSSSLTVDRTAIEFCSQNQIQMCAVPTHMIGTFLNSPSWNFAGVPFNYSNDEDIYKFTDSEDFAELSKECEEGLGITVKGTYMLGWIGLISDKPLNSVADIQGLKIGTGENTVYINTINGLGGSAASLAYSEVYTALQQGTIDGYTTTPGLYEASRFYEVTDSICCLPMLASCTIMGLNKEFYDSLPADLQEILDETLAETKEMLRRTSIEAAEASKENMRAAGKNVIEPSDEFIAECKEALADVVEDTKKNVVGEDFMAKVDAIIAG